MKEEEIITSQQRRLAQEVGRRDHPITTMKTGQSKQKIITRVFATEFPLGGFQKITSPKLGESTKVVICNKRG